METVRVLDVNGNFLSESKRCNKIRILLKQNKAIVISKSPFTIQLLFEIGDDIMKEINNYFSKSETDKILEENKSMKEKTFPIVTLEKIEAINNITDNDNISELNNDIKKEIYKVLKSNNKKEIDKNNCKTRQIEVIKNIYYGDWINLKKDSKFNPDDYTFILNRNDIQDKSFNDNVYNSIFDSVPDEYKKLFSATYVRVCDIINVLQNVKNFNSLYDIKFRFLPTTGLYPLMEIQVSSNISWNQRFELNFNLDINTNSSYKETIKNIAKTLY